MLTPIVTQRTAARRVCAGSRQTNCLATSHLVKLIVPRGQRSGPCSKSIVSCSDIIRSTSRWFIQRAFLCPAARAFEFVCPAAFAACFLIANGSNGGQPRIERWAGGTMTAPEMETGIIATALPAATSVTGRASGPPPVRAQDPPCPPQSLPGRPPCEPRQPSAAP